MTTLTQIDEQARNELTEALNSSLGEGKWQIRTEQDANGTRLIVSTREQPPREWTTRLTESASTPEQQRAALQSFASQIKAGASQPAGVQLPPDVQATGGQQAPRPAEDTSTAPTSSNAPAVDAPATLGQQAAVGGDAQAPSSAAESRADAGAAEAEATAAAAAAEAASSSSSLSGTEQTTEQSRRRR